MCRRLFVEKGRLTCIHFTLTLSLERANWANCKISSHPAAARQRSFVSTCFLVTDHFFECNVGYTSIRFFLVSFTPSFQKLNRVLRRKALKSLSYVKIFSSITRQYSKWILWTIMGQPFGTSMLKCHEQTHNRNLSQESVMCGYSNPHRAASQIFGKRPTALQPKIARGGGRWPSIYCVNSLPVWGALDYNFCLSSQTSWSHRSPEVESYFCAESVDMLLLFRHARQRHWRYIFFQYNRKWSWWTLQWTVFARAVHTSLRKNNPYLTALSTRTKNRWIKSTIAG